MRTPQSLARAMHRIRHARHDLRVEIDAERARPRPDEARLKSLKRLRLALKDKAYALSRRAEAFAP